MTTTHDVAEAAQQLLFDALENPFLNISDALAAAASDPLARIVAERALAAAGFDEVWYLTQAPTSQSAFDGMRAVAYAGIDLTQHYGPNAAALMGILRAAIECSEHQVRSVGYQLRGFEDDIFGKAFTLADALGVGGMLAHVCSDVHFAADAGKGEAVTAPGARIVHLKGVRGFELAAAYYVLEGAGWTPTHAEMHDLLDPVLKTFFPGGRVA